MSVFVCLRSIATIFEVLSRFQSDLYEDEVIDQHCSDFVALNAWKLFQKEEYFINLSLKHLTYIWEHDTNPEGANKLPETCGCDCKATPKVSCAIRTAEVPAAAARR